MQSDLGSSWNLAGSFLLLVVRMAGALSFVPIPGTRNALSESKIVLILCLAAAMFPLRPAVGNLPSTAGQFVLWLAGEAGFGLTVGLVAGLIGEGLLLGIQAISIQAGFSFATTFDPGSQADSGVLQILATLVSNLLFLALGVHHLVLRSFAASLDRWPAGIAWDGDALAGVVIRFGSASLELGLRLALPIAGLLLLSDLFLALAGRLHAQLQLLSLSFPLKLLACLAALAILAPAFVAIYSAAAVKARPAMEELLR